MYRGNLTHRPNLIRKPKLSRNLRYPILQSKRQLSRNFGFLRPSDT
jgi:hypothetical protein